MYGLIQIRFVFDLCWIGHFRYGVSEEAQIGPLVYI